MMIVSTICITLMTRYPVCHPAREESAAPMM